MNIGISCSICSASEDASEATTLLLDTYTGAQTAYSFNRKLRTDYSGSAFRVRRDSDNAELDIGYSGTNVDESALTTFVGANSAYVVTAYDQSGNSNDWTQSTANLQPRIVNAGTVEKVNGKIAIYNAPAIPNKNLTVTLTTTATNTAFHVYKNTNSYTAVNSSSGAAYGYSVTGSTDNSNSVAGTPSIYINSSLIGNTRDNLYVATNNIQVVAYFGVLDLSHVAWTAYNIDDTSSNAIYAVTYIHETIIYDSNKSSDRTAIETDINTYYTIY